MRAILPLAAAALAGAAQQTPTIRVPVRLVTVPVLVLDTSGRAVGGLAPKDFRVYDEGHAQSFRLNRDAPALSIAIAVQTSQGVRQYLPEIQKTAALLENSLAAETGETAILSYGNEVTVLKPFGSGGVSSAFAKLTPGGEKACLSDAGMEAVRLVAERPPSRSRILLLIGQPVDVGSKVKLDTLWQAADRLNVTVYGIAVPIYGKSFVSDTFSFSKPTGGGVSASVELTKLLPALKHRTAAKERHDPLSILTSQTGGIETRFRKQKELEDGIIGMGTVLRSSYVLSYSPDSQALGYHKVSVSVDVPEAQVHARPGYQRNGP